MATSALTCQVRVKKAEDDVVNTVQPKEAAIFSLKDYPDIGIAIRILWVKEVMKHFGQTHERHDRIRPWDFVAKLDGSVESLTAPVLESDSSKVYPTRFQIQLDTLCGLDHNEKVRRAEMFAMASLLYEIVSGKKPFEGLADDEVQQHFASGGFPNDAADLPCSLVILSGWSEEFSQEVKRRVKSQDANILQAASNYARTHPVLTGIQVVGLTLSALSFLAVPVLGAVGFTAAGSAANSAAAAWQASIEAVEAGSLFSWCQSAAMGGIQFAGLAGAAPTRVADIPGLMDTFRSGFRTPNSKW